MRCVISISLKINLDHMCFRRILDSEKPKGVATFGIVRIAINELFRNVN